MSETSKEAEVIEKDVIVPSSELKDSSFAAVSVTTERISTHIRAVQGALFNVIDELRKRALDHDLSKYSADELLGYCAFADMPKDMEYGSEEYERAKAEILSRSNCFEVHSATNDHHPEYHDYPEGVGHLYMMGLFELIEMVCDWYGAHKVYNESGKGKNWLESVEYNISKHDFLDSQKFVIREVAKFL